MLTLESFLHEIDAFLERSGMSATAFGKASVCDPNFVRDLRDGRMPGLRLVEKVDTFIRERSQPAEVER